MNSNEDYDDDDDDEELLQEENHVQISRSNWGLSYISNIFLPCFDHLQRRVFASMMRLLHFTDHGR